MGTLVKYYFAKKLDLQPENIYHVTIMPCYDKVCCGIISLLIPLQKLEASRDDFYNDLLKTRDVDCVLSTLEILDILKDKNIDFISLEEAPLENLYVILF